MVKNRQLRVYARPIDTYAKAVETRQKQDEAPPILKGGSVRDRYTVQHRTRQPPVKPGDGPMPSPDENLRHLRHCSCAFKSVTSGGRPT